MLAFVNIYTNVHRGSVRCDYYVKMGAVYIIAVLATSIYELTYSKFCAPLFVLIKHTEADYPIVLLLKIL